MAPVTTQGKDCAVDGSYVSGTGGPWKRTGGLLLRKRDGWSGNECGLELLGAARDS